MSDRKIIKQLEKAVGHELSQVDELRYDSQYKYTLNENGYVTGLGFDECGNVDFDRMASVAQGLNQLKNLQLQYSKLTDISFLKGLNQLRELNLIGNKITNFSVLKVLNQLEYFEIAGNEITDISFIKVLNKLKKLNLRNNKIIDISALNVLKQLQSLHIGINQISDFSVLKGLKYLTTLDLENNQISDLSDLKGLEQLQTLWLSDNQISDLSDLKELEQLQELGLTNNQISDLSDLKGLEQLQELRLTNNQISDISDLKGLEQLQTLWLRNNQISDISVLKKLTHLNKLDLRSNEIEHLPAWIVELGPEIVHEDSYYENGINLYDNPIITPPLEIVKKGKDAIQNYFASIKDKETVDLNEVKVLLVGEGMAGKTSFLKKLQGVEFDSEESQTHGINVVPINSEEIDGMDKFENLKDFRLNCWDFGGQEIMHASHTFFMSKRSLYILMLDSRTDSKKYYWLNHINKYGGDSPLIVVMNKIDINSGYNIEQNTINKAFPQIGNRFHGISCKNKKDKGLPGLIDCIAKTLPETSLFGTQISVDWMKIKDILISETKEKQYIDQARFQEICVENNVADESSQKTLLQFLNDIGSVLYFEDLNLSDIFVLDPHWITVGVYRIITSQRTDKGILKEEDLDYILNKEDIKSDEYDPAKKKITYSRTEQRYIVDIMKQFELCYEYSEGTMQYIIPALLPKELKEEPELEDKAPLIFIMQYDYLPNTVISRLMLRHKNEIALSEQWKFGMIVRSKIFNCQAKVLADENKKNITITVQGEQNRKSDLFAVIRNNILDISSEFDDLKIDEMIPLPGYPDRLVKFKQLLGHEKSSRPFYYDGELDKDFSVSEMLDRVISKADRDKGYEMSDKDKYLNVPGSLGNIRIAIGDVGSPTIVASPTMVASPTLSAELNADLTADLTATLTVTQQVKNVQGLFKNLKEDILDEIDIEIEDEKEKKRIQNELVKGEKAFAGLEKAAEKGQTQLDEGLKERVEKFVKNLFDENSRIRRGLRFVGDGIPRVQKLGRWYNKIAQNFGLNSIPPLLLGEEE